MSDITSEAKGLLNGIRDLYPLTTQVITYDEFTDTTVGRINSPSGYPAIRPHVESESMLVTSAAMFDFIVRAPEIIARLIDSLEERVESTPRTAVEAAVEADSGPVRSGGRAKS